MGVDLYDYEDFKVIYEETRISRKEHTCDVCNGIIDKKQQYVKHFSVVYDQVNSEKVCMSCWRTIDKLFEGGRIAPSTVFDFREDFVEANDDASVAILDQLYTLRETNKGKTELCSHWT